MLRRVRRLIFSTLVAAALVSIAFHSVIPPLFAQGSGYKTTYAIEIRDDGSAIWTVEDRVELRTAAEERSFEEYMMMLQSNESVLEYFSGKVNEIIAEAENSTGRGMAAKNFNISFGVEDTLTRKYGVVTYRFEWIGFAPVEDKKILVGDAFAAGLYLPEGNALIIRFPGGYKIASVTPEPDISRKNELIWYGLRDFGPGEPGIVIQEKIIPYSFIWIVPGAVFAAVLILSFFYKNRTPKKIVEETKSDEERIIEILRAAGGMLYQSEIIEKTGFSKSKTSTLLNSLKKKGRIEKIMKGRRNLIRLK